MFDWRAVHDELVAIAAKRGSLDAEEARWLREAERVEVWKRFGTVGALDYMERVLGYAPHTAAERLRVARALGELPAIEGALAGGELHQSAVREVSRIATRETEDEWLDAIRGKSLRLVEELVAGKRRGDRPGDPAREDARMHRVTFELSADVYARLRDARARLADEHGRRLDDDALVSALCESVFGDRGGSEPSGRAKFQIAVSVCPTCDHATQDGGGRAIAIDDASLERARCDAQHVGSIDGDEPERARQDIPPAVVRFVWRRGHGKCQAPGCRSARGLEVHHLVRRADGGDHSPANLVLLCSACHLAHHRGHLRLDGGSSHVGRDSAEDQLVHESANHAQQRHGPAEDAPSHVGREVVLKARDALETLGYARETARDAVELAVGQLRDNASLEQVLREALRSLAVPNRVA
jgi:hypothetical protein|nr:HNH endonuclease [Kofleriaceae bacterium]